MSHSTSGSRAAAETGSVLGLQMPALTGGSVLGASTPAVAGAAILPVTGNNPLVLGLVIVSMAISILVVTSFIVTRVIRKFM